MRRQNVYTTGPSRHPAGSHLITPPFHNTRLDRAWRLDREADNELLLGHIGIAERLATEAAALREAAP
jgi:hypothetical protein